VSKLVRSIVLQDFNKLIEELGGNPERVILDSKLDPAILKDPNSRIEAGEVVRVLHLAALESDCSTFGLELGRRRNLEDYLGFLGDLARSATNLGDAITEVFQYIEIHAESSLWQLETRNNVGYIIFSSAEEYEDPIDQVQQLVIVLAWRTIRALSGGSWHPTMVAFPFDKPENSLLFRQTFNVPVQFDADYCGIVFHYSDLAIGLSTSNNKLHGLLRKRADDFIRHRKRDFPDMVRTLIRKNLEFQRLGEEEITAFFPFSKRTFQRRLRTEGTSYQKLLAEVRMSVAQKLLTNTSTSVTRIADRLGYGDIAAFSKAFSRNTGFSPHQWRSRR